MPTAIPAPGRRFVAVTFGVLAALIGGIGYGIFSHERESLKHSAESNLSSIGDLKVRQLNEWLGERKKDATAFSRHAYFAEAAQQLSTQGGGLIASKLKDRLSWIAESYGYRHVTLFDRHGRLLVSSRDNVLIDDVERATLHEIARTGRSAISDFHRAGEDVHGGVEIDVAVPVFADRDANDHRAILNFDVDPETFIQPLMRAWPTPSASGETLLVKRDGDSVLYLGKLRFRDDPPLTLRLPIEQVSLPFTTGFNGQTGIFRARDYRGVDVLADVRPVPETPWVLVTKIDEGEVYRSVRSVAIAAAALTALFILAAALTTLAWVRTTHAQQQAREAQLEVKALALAKHYAEITRYVNDIILLIDEEGRVVDCNDRASSVYGYSREELLGMKLPALRGPEAAPSFEQERSTWSEEGMVYETEHATKDGRTLIVEASVRALEVEGRRFFQAVVRDITERKRAEQAALEQLQLAETYFNSSISCHVILDSNFNFLRVNAAYARACRRDIAEFAGRNHFELYPSDTKAIFEEVVRTRRPFETFTRPFVFADQPERGVTYWDWTLVPMLDNKGQVQYLFFSLNEVTERKRAEDGLRKVNRALTTISACNQALIRASEERQLLEDMCHIIIEAGGYQRAWVGFAEYDEQKTVKPVAYAGYEQGFLERAKVTWADCEQGSGPIGTAIRTRQPQVVQNTRTDPRFAPWRDNAVRLGYGSILALPLAQSTSVLGALVIHGAEVDAFDGNEVALLGELADDLTYGINARRLYADHERGAQRLQQSMESTVAAIAATVEMRDPYTAGHQRRVAELATAIAQDMELAQDRIHAIHLAAVVHDVGKIRIPAEILSKPSQLTDIEFQLIKDHSRAGYEVLKPIDFPWPVARIVLEHHERMDGSGYPRALKSEAILLEARILAVADTVEAMASHRPYRPSRGIEAALAEIQDRQGLLYEPSAVQACVKLFREKHFTFSA